MAENRSRFVLLCQQALVFGTVAAVVAPAANLISLDIVTPAQPGATAAPAPQGVAPAPARSVVATAPVAPTVSTVPLAGVTRAGLRALRGRVAGPSDVRRGSEAAQLASATTATSGPDDLTVLSAPQPVDGLATIGVTWAQGVHVPDSDITIAVRTKRDDVWSGWTTVPYHDDEGPDPDSADGRADKPGTDPVYVGHVQDVQIRALTASGQAPAGMRLSLVDPGSEHAPAAEQPAIDTAVPGGSAATLTADETGEPTDGATDEPVDGTTDGTSDGTSDGTTDGAALSAAVTSKPRIYSRAQWGADERMRDASSLHYGEVHGGFVHHTVNANGYSRAQVPALLRGIYAFHTQSRGWSDIGYNFLVDRFGRIWEGRYGGVGRPVVGAHTLGYNDDAFAMSAIGNYDITQPSRAMVAAFGRLFAWKLSLHGVAANATHQWVEKAYLRAIQGHRDVGQTACPGRYLYAKIPRIRVLATRDQRSWAGRARATRLTGGTQPDLVMRDRHTKQVYLLRTTPRGRAGSLVATGTTLPHATLVLNAGDWDGDGIGDVVTRSATTGRMWLYRGTGSGRFSPAVRMGVASFAGVRMMAAVGDMTGDGHPDLMGQRTGGAMRIYPGNGRTGFARGYVAHAGIRARSQLGLGLWTADGAPDSLLRTRTGSLVLYPGNGPGGLTGGTTIGSVGTIYDWVISVGDLDADGRPDLVARSRATGKLWLLPGTATGFGKRRVFGTADMGRFDIAN